MFAASIGVLRRGRPVVGAVWCSTGHALRPGVYHASAGGKLRFEGNDVTPKLNPAVRRRLAGVPVVTANGKNWETRKTGSAAIGVAGRSRHAACCAFRQPEHLGRRWWHRPSESRGRHGPRQRDGHWETMQGFASEQPSVGGEADLRFWRHPVIVGASEAVERMCAG